MRFTILILLVFPLFLSAQLNSKAIAYKQIVELKKSVVLVRLHTDEAVVAQMKKMHQNKMLKTKLQEIETNNKEIFMAFKNGYSFTEVYFFYGKDSERVKAKEFDNIFVNSDLNTDTSITLDTSQFVFIIDVGDIYFEAFGGHFEGMVVMDDQFVPLKKPFPYYVRKRSGFSIIRRSNLDMVLILQRKLDKHFEEAELHGFTL